MMMLLTSTAPPTLDMDLETWSTTTLTTILMNLLVQVTSSPCNQDPIICINLSTTTRKQRDIIWLKSKTQTTLMLTVKVDQMLAQ